MTSLRAVVTILALATSSSSANPAALSCTIAKQDGIGHQEKALITTILNQPAATHIDVEIGIKGAHRDRRRLQRGLPPDDRYAIRSRALLRALKDVDGLQQNTDGSRGSLVARVNLTGFKHLVEHELAETLRPINFCPENASLQIHPSPAPLNVAVHR